MGLVEAVLIRQDRGRVLDKSSGCFQVLAAVLHQAARTVRGHFQVKLQYTFIGPPMTTSMSTSMSGGRGSFPFRRVQVTPWPLDAAQVLM
jgi:hypothetical protein